MQREDGTGRVLVCPPGEYEEARWVLVRHALEDNVEAVELLVAMEDGAPRVVRLVIDR